MKLAKQLLPLLFGMLLSGCGTVDVNRQPSTALPSAAVKSTFLGAWADQASQGQEAANGVRLLSDGREAFALRTSLANHAQKTLDVQSYIFEDDHAGRALLERMLKAAERGVRVRLLLDDTASLGKQELLAAFASHANVQVRLFNPIPVGRSFWLSYHLALVADFERLHQRMHNKLWLTDNAVAITGGRNLADEYFAIADENNFDDLDVVAVGPTVNALSASFDAYWNHPLAVPIERFERASARAWRELVIHTEARPAPEGELLVKHRLVGGLDALLGSLTWAPAIALWDLPDKLANVGYPALGSTLLGQLGDAFRQLERRLLIVSPYVIPTQASIDYQAQLSRRGIEVTILTNALEATDLPSLHSAYAPWRPELLANGARLYELRANPERGEVKPKSGKISSLHTKAMAFDERRLFVGSLNADPRAVWWNSEVGLLIDSPKLTRQLWAQARHGMDPRRSYALGLRDEGGLVWHTQVDGRMVALTEEPGSFTRRFKALMLSLLGIEHLL
nr:phospholipase D family protein [uncultured Halomonas sp.]